MSGFDDDMKDKIAEVTARAELVAAENKRLRNELRGARVQYDEACQVLESVRASFALVDGNFERMEGAIRAIHVQKLDYKGRPYCEECASLCHSRSGLGCDDVDGAWPCATIAALDGP